MKLLLISLQFIELFRLLLEVVDRALAHKFDDIIDFSDQQEFSYGLFGAL